MRALFLADAHLCKPTDPNYQALLTFLESQRGKTDLLVLLGDIFEFWIGKETVITDHRPIIECFESMCQTGTRLVYVEGNHDFHLGPVFSQRLKCQILPDGGSIEIDGKKVFLAHGDLANPNDTGYRKLRKVLRSGMIRTLIRTLPNQLIMSIAARASYQSRKSSGEKHYQWPASKILIPYATKLIAEGNQAVVTGHYHQPMYEKLEHGELIALGDWITQFSYAVYEEGAFSLRNYSDSLSSVDRD